MPKLKVSRYFLAFVVLFPSVHLANASTLEKLSEAEEAGKVSPVNGWRQFDGCWYKWDAWRLSANSRIRTTKTTCHPMSGIFAEGEAIFEISVDCSEAKIKETIIPNYNYSPLVKALAAWKRPTGANREMVIALCDNLIR